MGIFDGILMASDIDGTLLGSDHRVSTENREAIRRFQAQGGRFTLATGRMPSSMARFLEGLRLDAPAICYNGAMVYDLAAGRALWRRELDAEAGAAAAWVLERYPDVAAEIYTDDAVHLCRRNAAVDEHLRLESLDLRPAELGEINRPWIKVLFAQDPELTERLRRELPEAPFGDRYQLVRSGPHFFELLPRGVSKGEALLELCRLTGQDPARTVAAGDNDNDLDMLAKAGLGVAVGNAADHVRSAAGHVTVRHDEHAISRIIEDLEAGRLRV